MDSVLLLTLRRLRRPLVVLVVVYAVGILGMVLIPGIDAAGNPAPMGFFHAFYFLSYTASTIGFGEIPNAFTDQQRLWVTIVIYMSVVAWAYTIASVLTLIQDSGFRHALTEQRFRRQVQRLHEPFYIVCGYGETGALVCRTLDHWGLRFTVLDLDRDCVDAVDLSHYASDAPAFSADASTPDHLLAAGLTNPSCRGVLALTDDDAANLSVAITVRLLNPSVPVLARAMTRSVADNMASFGTDHVVNPFQIFGETLANALEAPATFRLIMRLTGLLRRSSDTEGAPPRGAWLVCGYGRFGREVVGAFDRESLKVTVIDPSASVTGQTVIQGVGTEAEPLLRAGVKEAVGIVAGTDNDVNNLSIAVTARELNPGLYVIVRQNLRANHRLFEAFDADVTVVSAELIAGRCLAIISTPLLSSFLDLARKQSQDWALALSSRLDALNSTGSLSTWSIQLGVTDAPAIHEALAPGAVAPRVADLLRSPSDRAEQLSCLPLLLRRGGRDYPLPPDDMALERNDEILFAGRLRARRSQQLTLANVNALDYVRTGRDLPGGWIWQRLTRRDEKIDSA
jgi:voltage-gated potassium channel Kch